MRFSFVPTLQALQLPVIYYLNLSTILCLYSALTYTTSHCKLHCCVILLARDACQWNNPFGIKLLCMAWRAPASPALSRQYPLPWRDQRTKIQFGIEPLKPSFICKEKHAPENLQWNSPWETLCFSKRIHGEKRQSNNYRPGFLPRVGNEQRKGMWLGSLFCAWLELCLRSAMPSGGGVTLDQERVTGRDGSVPAAAPSLARSIPAALWGDEQCTAASTMAWLWCIYHSAGLHQLLLAAPYFCLVKEGFSGAFSQKRNVLLSCTTGDNILVSPRVPRDDLEAFQQSGILLERPFWVSLPEFNLPCS